MDGSKHAVTKDSKIIKVLKNGYNISPLHILKECDTEFKITTESQNLLLHKCTHRHDSCIRGLYIQTYLKEKGFPYTFDIVKSISGGNYVKYGHSFYYLEKKVEGIYTPIDSLQDYKKACQVLGAFHSYASGFMYKDYPLRDNIKRLGHKIQDKVVQAYSIKSIIERKNINSDFDKSYICIVDQLIKRLELCRELSLGYELLCEEARQKPYICHNSLTKDLFRSEGDALYINSFTSCSIDIPIYELSNLIKDFISLNVYNLKFDTIKELIDIYNASRPISLNEYKILLCLLIMPDKLMSIGKKRYIKQKNWSERKYLQRLDKALLLFNRQQQLIQPFSAAYRISI